MQVSSSAIGHGSFFAVAMSLPLLTDVVVQNGQTYRFLIMDAPRGPNISEYIREMKKRQVTDIVRVCEEITYKAEDMEKAQITVHDMSFRDGTTPQADILQKWLTLCREKFVKNKASGTIAVHCVAGLGRAPLMVAIALIESGRDYTKVVELIRNRRSGCINRRQLEFLKGYTPQGKQGCCVIC